MMYHGEACSLSSPFVTFGYSFLLVVHLICFTLSLKCFFLKFETYKSKKNNQFTSLTTSCFALLGDISGVCISICGILQSLFSGDQNLESTLTGFSAMGLGLFDVCSYLNVCLVWFALTFVGDSFGKRGKIILIGLILASVIVLGLTFILTAKSLVEIFTVLGSISNLIYSILFVIASRLLSTKLTQIAATIPQEIPTPQTKKSIKVAENKIQGRDFFHIKSKSSVVLEVQPKIASPLVGVKKNYAPSPGVSSNFARWSMAVHRSTSATANKDEIDRSENESRPFYRAFFPHQIQMARNPPAKPEVNTEQTSFQERNLQQIQRVQKCSRWLSRILFVCSVATAILAPVYSNSTVGALPCFCLFVSLFCSLLARATIVQYLRGSHRLLRAA